MTKFKRGDIVRVASLLPLHKRHFPGAGELAVIAYGYQERYGNGIDDNGYALLLRNGREVAWYDAHELTLVLAALHDDPLETAKKVLTVMDVKA